MTYDAFGCMVEQNRSGSYTEIDYAPTGAKLQLLNGQNAVTDFVPLPGGATAVYTAQAGGLAYYRHSDWLGSSRLASTPSRTVYYDGAYGPFGEPYAQSGTPDLNFTGMNQDTASNVYDFPMREYGIQGRWPSPDPAGLAAVNPMDPQTWNRYAYVRNSPLELVDPLGLQECTAVMCVIVHDPPPPPSPCDDEPGCIYPPIGPSDPPPPPHAPQQPGKPGGSPGGNSSGPTSQAPTHPYLNCVANSGNEASLQGLLGLGNSKIAGAFLGNPISDLINAFAGNGSASASVGDAASAAAPTALRQAPNVAVSYTSTTITASPSEVSIISNKTSTYLALGDIASGAAEVLEGFTKLVQAPVDITASAFGAVTCAAGE